MEGFRIGAAVGARHTVGLPDAGAFRVVDPPGCCDWAGIVALHNATGALDAKCVAAHPPPQAWRCFTAPTMQPYIAAPLFVLQSQFDHFQLSAMVRHLHLRLHFPPYRLAGCGHSRCRWGAISSHKRA